MDATKWSEEASLGAELAAESPATIPGGTATLVAAAIAMLAS